MSGTVWLIFGVSGSGKSTIAREISSARGRMWLQADDLRLAVQHSPVAFDDGFDPLTFYREGVWDQPDEWLADRMVDMATHMLPGIRVVIECHLATGIHSIIEGDCLHPALLTDPVLAPFVNSGAIRAVCLATPGGDQLRAAIEARGVEQPVRAPGETYGNAYVLRFGTWLEATLDTFGIPIVASRPFTGISERVLHALEQAT